MLTLVFEHGSRAPAGGGRQACVWRDERGDTFAEAFVAGRLRWIEWRDLGVFAFSLGSTTVHAWPRAGIDRATIADAFARVLQPIILQALGGQALHASAVMGDDEVLAFCGVGRSGKSTLAYALGQDGFEQVADDALVIEPAGSRILAHLLPFAPGLRLPARQHFELCPSHFETGDRTIGASPKSASLRAAIVLQQDQHLTRPERPRQIAPVQAFSALVTHARCFDEVDPVHTRQLVADYLEVAEHVPVFAIRYPPRFAQFAQLIECIKALATELGITRRRGHLCRPALTR